MMKFSPYDWTEADMIGGNAALDFVNTVSRWRDEPTDQLGDASGFARWVRVAGLLDDDDQKVLEAEISGDPKIAAAFYKDAARLREAMYRIFTAAASGERASDEDLETLNRWQVRAAKHCQIQHEGGVFRRRCTEDAPAQERAMRVIFDAAEDLLLNGRLDRLRTCGGDHCEWMFLDLSKNGKRRWCSMATCGNEHKVKQFRKRKKQAAA